MSKIINEKLSSDMKIKLEKMLPKLKCGITLDSLKNIEGDIKYILSDNEIVSFCIYSAINKDIVLNDFENACDYYDDESKEEYINLIENFKKDTIYIYYIESLVEGKGYGKAILDSILSLGKNVVLYSASDAEDFWIGNNFENVFGYEYIYFAK